MKYFYLSIVSVLFFAGNVLAEKNVKIAFLAPDGLTPQNSAVYNGMRDAFSEFRMRYNCGFSLEYFSAGNSQAEQVSQLGGAYIDGFAGAVVFPVSGGGALGGKISDLAGKNFPVALAGRDVPDSKRLCFVGTDSAAAAKRIAELLKKHSPRGKIPLYCYFKTTEPTDDLSVSDAVKITPFLGLSMSAEQFRSLVEPYRCVLVGAEYYSVYAQRNAVEIMRRDDYGELFFNPYLFADMMPIKRDSDRRFAICIGAIPQLEQRLADGFLTACVYGDYYGWGYFAARALAEKIMDKTEPSQPVRLLEPLTATSANPSAFSADWRKWMK